MNGTWKTTGGGGGDSLLAGLVLFGLAIAVGGGVMAGVAQAVAELAVWIFVLTGVIAASAIAGVVLLVIYRHRHPGSGRMSVAPEPRVWLLTDPERPPMQAPRAARAIEQHVHFHGMDAERMADALRNGQSR